MTIKLQVGKYYKLRNGHYAFVQSDDVADAHYRFTGYSSPNLEALKATAADYTKRDYALVDGRSWDEDGNWLRFQEYDEDIVEEFDPGVSNAPAVSLEQAQAIVASKAAPKVTKEHIEGKISQVDYVFHHQLTICIITMKNGFKQIGKAAPASPENYDPEVGKRYAYEDAFRGLWHLEGYLLCERLHGEAVS